MRLCMLALSSAVLSTAAVASDLPKEGTFTTTVSIVGTYKAITLGKNLWAAIFDDTETTIGGGLMDHLTWHCMGVNSGINGQQGAKGNCVTTDPGGDQMFIDFTSDPAATDAKVVTGKSTFVEGSGKYVGVTGSYRWNLHTTAGGEFKLAPDLTSTYVLYGTFEGSYKLK
jgi:hypothetical protein